VFVIQLLEHLVYGTSQESFNQHVDAIKTQYPAFHKCVHHSILMFQFLLLLVFILLSSSYLVISFSFLFVLKYYVIVK